MVLHRPEPVLAGLHKGWLPLLGVSLLILVCPPREMARGDDASAMSPGGGLDQMIRSVIEAPGYRNGHWGMLVVDARTGAVLCDRNSDQLFAPASVTKLFSTAAALVEFGPDHRFQTPVIRRGDIDSQGTLHGDLILLAQGDLSMGGRTGPDGTLLFKDDDHTYAGGNPRSDIVSADPMAGLDHLASEVRAAGITYVTGDVIIDDRLFDQEESTGSGPRRLTPIMINDNVVDVLVQPGKAPGDPASVSLVPATGYLSADIHVETVVAAAGSAVEIHAVGPRRLTIRGKITIGSPRLVLIHEIDDPGAFARALFIESLRKHGVKTEASPLGTNSTTGLASTSTTDLARLPKVAEYTSPPFREYLKVILKVSHNLQASTLPMLLAAHKGERTLAAGLRRQEEILKSLGVDATAVSFGGGAGGSRSDLVTPRATVTLLKAMMSRRDFAGYHAALPVLGRDGTLARAVPADSPARGHAHAKTGTYCVDNGLNGKAVLTSKALAGYLETATGRPLIVAIFVNNVMLDAPRPGHAVADATAEAGRTLGKLCEILYSSTSNTPNGGNANGKTRERHPEPVRERTPPDVKPIPGLPGSQREPTRSRNPG